MLPALNPTQTVSSGLPLPELAHELGVSPQSLRNWLGQAQIDAGEREG
jgi:transposase-like protein